MSLPVGKVRLGWGKKNQPQTLQESLAYIAARPHMSTHNKAVHLISKGHAATKTEALALMGIEHESDEARAKRQLAEKKERMAKAAAAFTTKPKKSPGFDAWWAEQERLAAERVAANRAMFGRHRAEAIARDKERARQGTNVTIIQGDANEVIRRVRENAAKKKAVTPREKKELTFGIKHPPKTRPEVLDLMWSSSAVTRPGTKGTGGARALKPITPTMTTMIRPAPTVAVEPPAPIIERIPPKPTGRPGKAGPGTITKASKTAANCVSVTGAPVAGVQLCNGVSLRVPIPWVNISARTDVQGAPVPAFIQGNVLFLTLPRPIA